MISVTQGFFVSDILPSRSYKSFSFIGGIDTIGVPPAYQKREDRQAVDERNGR
jgi:hypothetical protein